MDIKVKDKKYPSKNKEIDWLKEEVRLLKRENERLLRCVVNINM